MKSLMIFTDKLFSSQEDELPTGADSVRTAIDEYEHIENRTFTANLGEPEIVNEYGLFVTDPKIIVPVENGPFNSSTQLVFDLPEGRNDDYSTFIEMLELFDLDVNSMEQLNGLEVFVSFMAGNLVVMWDTIKDDSGKAEDEQPNQVTIEEDQININAGL